MDEWEDRLAGLAAMPARVAGFREAFAGDGARARPEPQAFSYVEQVWHLADLEVEGFGERIRRLLAEEAPALSNFDGARMAAERDYPRRDVAEGLGAFAEARARNVEALRRTTAAERSRSGVQEGVGTLRLVEIPLRMLEHDRSHRSEIEALLRAVAGL
ncbi:MAG TPA: DinB family protein [Thermoanaerobaculia bacterium]|nr:DinB family protein [Thermoanaerobaculia bacterium]